MQKSLKKLSESLLFNSRVEEHCRNNWTSNYSTNIALGTAPSTGGFGTLYKGFLFPQESAKIDIILRGYEKMRGKIRQF